MCGIAFVYRPELAPDALARAMDQSLSLLARRGPDGSGIVAGQGWCAGHRRLAVIDPEGSPQPFTDPTGRYCMTYNGELYNYKELKKRLSPHWVFRSNGDVEVVLAGLILYDTAFLEMMEGMWALALWDSRARRLLLVRDRMGKKPLYYQAGNGAFACSSELPALAPLSWFTWREDERGAADYLRYGCYLPGTTAYGNVKEVLPGHCLSWRPGKHLAQHAYWRLSPGGFTAKRGQAVRQLRHIVIEGVKRRLVADVEVGALLSGGIDSSLITAIIRKHLKQPLKTFTLGFSANSWDERRYARDMAAFIGSDHHEARLSLDSQSTLLALIARHMGQPFGDASLLPTALVSQLAAEKVKVVVSGDGGDELFCGYQRYLARSLLRWYTRLPEPLKATTGAVAGAFKEPDRHHSASFLKKAHLFLEAARRCADETPYIAPLMYSRDQQRQLMPDMWRLGHLAPKLPQVTHPDTPDALQQMMIADALIYLPQDILAKVDRAGMAYSLEVRSPFMDRRIVEFAFSLPRPWHRLGWIGKRMLRDAFTDLLPAWVRRRRKHGFGAPVHLWFRTGLQNDLADRVEQVQHNLNKSYIRGMIQEHVGRRRDHGLRLWHLYVYLHWLGESHWRIF